MNPILKKKKVAATYPLSSRILPFLSKEAFMLIAKGDGMEPRINDKDYLICQNADDFKDGEIIVVADKQDNLIIRKAMKDGVNVILERTNRKYLDSISLVKKGELRVVGVVRSIIKMNV